METLPFLNSEVLIPELKNAVGSILFFFKLSKLHFSPTSCANSVVQGMFKNSAIFNTLPAKSYKE